METKEIFRPSWF